MVKGNLHRASSDLIGSTTKVDPITGRSKGLRSRLYARMFIAELQFSDTAARALGLLGSV
jgi:hypothetical protein